ncbi:MAG: DUF3450 domain-containing protein [Prosthecobacter sp.]|nr:DUF3450 domain-containing protein [Prosthecobacter sp.]
MKHPLCLLLLAFSAILARAQAPAPSPASDYLGLSRELLGKYYEIRKLHDKERADWTLGREVLKSRLELLESQLKELKTKTEEESKKITGNDEERVKLEARAQELAQVQSQQVDVVEMLEARVRRLWKMLPPTLQSKLQSQYDGIPEEGKKREDIRASVAERFLKVLAILNEVNKFHSDIAVVNERRKLKDGREVEVRTLYFGLAQAYFAGSEETANVAGIGIPGPDGWEWKEMPDHAAAIDLMIAINKGEKPADFVPLPAEVH